MSKVDWIVITFLTVFTCFCFWMDSKVWLFLAGVCSTLFLGISVGYLFKGSEQQMKKKSWDEFLNKMQEETNIPEFSR